jgi:broad specificity phosphatase PhoE
MEKSILTFRHGQPVEDMQKCCRGGSSDCDLSSEGRFQTEANVSYLVQRFGRNLSDVLVVTSDMKRTNAFGELMEKQGAMYARDPRFAAIHAGMWKGMSWEHIRQQWPDQFRNCTEDGDNLVIPDGERIDALEDRVLSAWQEWIKERCTALIVVAHDSTNAIIKRSVSADGPLNLRGQTIGAAHEYAMESDGRIHLVAENMIPYRNPLPVLQYEA